MTNNDELVESLRNARSDINQLQRRLDQLQARTNLVSTSFLKRAFAVLGHYLVASLIICVPIYALIFVIAIAAGAFGR